MTLTTLLEITTEPLVTGSIDRLWIDIETTGINTPVDHMLEVGLAIGDVYGNVGDVFHSLVWNVGWESKLESAAEVVRNMHRDSGLADELREAQKDKAWIRQHTIEAVQSRINEWLYVHEFDNQQLRLAGSSVHFDRGFIQWNMNSSNKLLHYRNVDVSTLKTLCEGLNPVLYEKLKETVKPKKLHRVLPDISDTIEEYRFYVDNFLFWPEPMIKPTLGTPEEIADRIDKGEMWDEFVRDGMREE